MNLGVLLLIIGLVVAVAVNSLLGAVLIIIGAVLLLLPHARL
jgi:hypothetical protein